MSKVSIVIPSLNDSGALQSALPALIREIEGVEAEVIVVDNGSSDDSAAIARSLGARVLLEHDNPGSPYSARNRGIEAASGEILVLLDATCTPQRGWLAAGLATLGKEGGIVGGNVRFSFRGAQPTAAEALDAIIHIQMEREITLHRRAMTANLFISKKVFERRGLFREGIRSGEDIRWTAEAARSGERLVFCPDAVVHKPARDWAELRDKVRRTARGAPAILGVPKSALAVVKGILTPPNPWLLRASLQGRPEVAAALFWKVFIAAWRLRWCRAIGILAAILGKH